MNSKTGRTTSVIHSERLVTIAVADIVKQEWAETIHTFTTKLLAPGYLEAGRAGWLAVCLLSVIAEGTVERLQETDDEGAFSGAALFTCQTLCSTSSSALLDTII